MTRLGMAACLLAITSPAAAQTVNGIAEVTAVRGTNVSDGQTSTNNAMWQLYSIGYEAPLIDPRLLKYNTSVSFRSNSLDLGNTQTSQHGTQGGLGYALGASLFPTRPFPFFIQATRDIVNESSGYPSSSSSRAGLVLPADTPVPDFQTTTRALNAGWQLNTPSLPRVELNYRSGSSNVVGGPFDATRNDTDLHAAVFQDTAHTRQALRFERTEFSNAPVAAFNQRVSDLSYDFTALAGKRSRFEVRTGRRRTYSLFDLPSTVVDTGQGGYTLPSQGDVRSSYVTTGLTWEPAARLSFDVTGGFDRQDSETAALSSRLASASARLDVFRGFSINATGTYGDRGQTFNGSIVTVTTRSGLAGSTLRVGKHWLEFTLVGSRGIGMNETPEGQQGRVQTWSGQGTVSSSWRWIGLSTGYDRAINTDELLAFGNYTIERSRASAQHASGPFSISATAEDVRTTRGLGESLLRTRQQTYSGTASLSTGRGTVLSLNAGSFRTDTAPNLDRTMFYGGSYDMRITKALHLSAWGRRERVLATQRSLDQQNFYVLTSLEYALRLLSVGVEYRHNQQFLTEQGLLNPFQFRGHQFRIRLTRSFGVRR
jgi:hypothetical protein